MVSVNALPRVRRSNSTQQLAMQQHGSNGFPIQPDGLPSYASVPQTERQAAYSKAKDVVAKKQAGLSAHVHTTPGYPQLHTLKFTSPPRSAEQYSIHPVYQQPYPLRTLSSGGTGTRHVRARIQQHTSKPALKQQRAFQQQSQQSVKLQPSPPTIPPSRSSKVRPKVSSSAEVPPEDSQAHVSYKQHM